jgi:ankyrin repeat protein
MNRILTYTFLLLAFLAHAQVKSVFDVARKGNLQEIEAIYKTNPYLIDIADDRKSSPLILACYRGNTDVALFIAEKTKNINYNSGMGTALMAAVMSGNTTIIEKLIAVKADLNQTDTSGKTALIYAIFFNKTDIAKLLLQAGADKTLKDNDARTALDYANFNKNTELIILLDKKP